MSNPSEEIVIHHPIGILFPTLKTSLKVITVNLFSSTFSSIQAISLATQKSS
jgi:hypothetical protein